MDINKIFGSRLSVICLFFVLSISILFAVTIGGEGIMPDSSSHPDYQDDYDGEYDGYSESEEDYSYEYEDYESENSWENGNNDYWEDPKEDEEEYYYESSYDEETGATTHTWTDSEGEESHNIVETTTTDPETGETTSTSTWTDPDTGETHSTTYSYSTNEDTGTTTYTYTDPNTEESYTSTETVWTDPETGETTYTSTWTDPKTGESHSTSYSIYDDPETGEEIYSWDDSETGESYSSSYNYDPTTGEATTELSSGEIYEMTGSEYGGVYDEEKGLYIGTTPEGATWTYNPATGDYTVMYEGTVETGIDYGPDHYSSGNIIVTDEGDAYLFDEDDWVDNKLNEIIEYKESLGIILSEKEKERIKSELEEYAKGYSEGENAFSEVLKYDLPIHELEMDSETSISDWIAEMEEELGRPLTEDEKLYLYARYEEWKEEMLMEAWETDYFEETYEGQLEYYYDYDVPEEYQFFEDEEDYKIMLEWHKEFEERLAAGEDKAELEREFQERFEEKFGSDAIPIFEHPNIIKEKAIQEFKEEIIELENQGISLESDHPSAVALREKIEERFIELMKLQEEMMLDYMGSECQGEFGDSQEACEEKAETIKYVGHECSELTGDSQENCYEVLDEVSEFDCSGFYDVKACMEEYEKFKDEFKEQLDDEDYGYYIYEVDVSVEEQIALDVYKEWKDCLKNEEDYCEDIEEERVSDELLDMYELWDAEWSTLSEEEKEKLKQEWEQKKEEFEDLVQSKFDEAEVPEYVQVRFEEKEEYRFELMKELIDALNEKDLDTSKLEYYYQEYSEFMDAAQKSASENRYQDMAANLESADIAFSMFMEEAKSLVDS